MKGLLRKDLYLVWKYFKFYFLVVVIFEIAALFVPENPFFMVYPPALLAMLSISLQQFDEKAKWDVFADTLPCTRAQVVSGKYLICLMFTLPAMLLTLGLQSLQLCLAGSFSWRVLGNLTAILSAASFGMPIVSMPLMFKLGTERSRIVNYLFIGIVCGGSTAAGLLLDAPMTHAQLPGLAAALAALVLYIGSWALSVRFYEQREIG